MRNGSVCAHEWVPRNPVVKMCPACKSLAWHGGDKEMSEPQVIIPMSEYKEFVKWKKAKGKKK
jgi:hypothetical protein